jgi:hypothetical protein
MDGTRRKVRQILFSLIAEENDVCARAARREDSRIAALSRNARTRSRKDVRRGVDTVSDGMAISSLTRKDEDDNPDCDARKVHFRGSSICTGGHYAECIAYGSTLADATFILIRAVFGASSTAA